MTYNVFGGTLNLTQPTITAACHKRKSKEDLATNIPGRFTEDASQLSLSVVMSVVGEKVSSPNAPAGVGGSRSKAK